MKLTQKHYIIFSLICAASFVSGYGLGAILPKPAHTITARTVQHNNQAATIDSTPLDISKLSPIPVTDSSQNTITPATSTATNKTESLDQLLTDLNSVDLSE